MPRFLALTAVLVVLMVPVGALAQDDTKVVKVRDNVSMIISSGGGNVVVSAGDDGAFLIDDQLTPRADIIKQTVAGITDKPIKFIVNTHYHFDHTGGNEAFGEDGAVIVAHDNVYERLSAKQFITFFKKEMEPLARAGLPVVSFGRDITFHYNDDHVHVMHVPDAHTDGDVIAHFTGQDVIAAGDIIFNGMYPFIDIEHGGSIRGVVSALDAILALAGDGTKILPGHGPVMSKADVQAYRDMLADIAGKVEAAIKAGKTREEAVAEKPTQDYDATTHGTVVNADAFAGIVYDSLKP